VNMWLIAAIVLTLGLLPCGYVCLRGGMMDRLVAVELAGVVMTLLVVLLARGFERPAILDLALALALLSFPATLVYAFFLERWL
jgi:multicomponent Na+:H+ antiporter subunit F